LAEEPVDKSDVNKNEVEVTAEELGPSNGGDKAAAEEEAPAEQPKDSGPSKGNIELDVKTESRPRGDGHGPERGSRGFGNPWPNGLSDDEKLKRYKKQSEERLLDIKRSREAKIGKRRGR
jgi:hypothetical protein